MYNTTLKSWQLCLHENYRFDLTSLNKSSFLAMKNSLCPYVTCPSNWLIPFYFSSELLVMYSYWLSVCFLFWLPRASYYQIPSLHSYLQLTNKLSLHLILDKIVWALYKAYFLYLIPIFNIFFWTFSETQSHFFFNVFFGHGCQK